MSFTPWISWHFLTAHVHVPHVVAHRVSISQPSSGHLHIAHVHVLPMSCLRVDQRQRFGIVHPAIVVSCGIGKGSFS